MVSAATDAYVECCKCRTIAQLSIQHCQGPPFKAPQHVEESWLTRMLAFGPSISFSPSASEMKGGPLPLKRMNKHTLYYKSIQEA